MNWFRYIIIGTIILSTFGFVIYQVLQFFFSIQVSSSKFKKDINQLKLKLAEIKENLVVINNETLRLLSYDKEEDFIKDKISVYKEGVFTSIYHEPMIAYVFKQYITRMDKAVLLAETKEDTYEYYISSESTRVMKNDKAYGVIHSDGKFINSEGVFIASIELEDKKLLNIKTEDNTIAMLNNPNYESSGLSRSFELLDTNKKEEEEVILVLGTLLAVQVE